MSSTLHFLYQTKPGRCALRVLTRPSLSKAAGRFLDSPLSRPLIRPFVRHAGIRTEDFLTDGVRSFNDFFHREIKADKRPVDMRPESLIAPCDGLLRAFRIKDDTVLPVKESRYTIPALLRNASLAARYKDGVCLVFRLSVSHYHRYAYIESGTKSPDRSIPGVLHTVQPIALREVPVFTENERTYTLIRTERFGTILQMEVGAMLVGRIENHETKKARVARGQEKGWFSYGGSTIIVLLEKDRADIDSPYFEAADRGEEIPCCLGERIGTLRA